MGSNKKYIVRLTEEERRELRAMVKKGRVAAYKIKHANILLKADVDAPGWTDVRIAEAFGCHPRTVENVRRRCVLEGLDAAIIRRRQKKLSRERKLDGEGEARLVTIACSEAPDGRDRWTLQLMADELVRLKVVDVISDQTVRRTLKKTRTVKLAG